jgi:MFS superfamily sulfate permease-like transporter
MPPHARLLQQAVAPLASGDQKLYDSISVMLALLAGVMCIGASFLRLGLSRIFSQNQFL